jgi:bifunctional N-acetylglucosamine-1-phosphate-uridyltransferase/glucosamine-1-phosphate-acetyltransferase GlmU-like protein
LPARLDAGMDGAILGFEPVDPTGYGRFITENGDKLLAIREHKDATDEERRIGLCNSCILAFRRAGVPRTDRQGEAEQFKQGEFYLTDLVELANARPATGRLFGVADEGTCSASTIGRSWRGPKSSSRSAARRIS